MNLISADAVRKAPSGTSKATLEQMRSQVFPSAVKTKLGAGFKTKQYKLKSPYPVSTAALTSQVQAKTYADFKLAKPLDPKSSHTVLLKSTESSKNKADTK